MFSYYMVAGRITKTTFTVRAGLESANQLDFNGVAGGRKFGGAYASSITITEYEG